MNKTTIKRLKLFCVYFCISALCVIVDFFTKKLAVAHLKDGTDIRALPYLFNLTYVENRGAAWGMFADNRWVFMVISTVAIIALLFVMYIYSQAPKGFTVPLALIIGGGVGNMIDRVAKGYVVDFLQFDFWKSFPVFNAADCFITVGAFAICIYFVFFDKTILKDNKSEKTDVKDENTD